MDLNGGVSFRKGCFVGQEVVSRMHHRKSARKRIAVVDADGALPASGTAIEAGGRSVGTLGTVVGERALGAGAHRPRGRGPGRRDAPSPPATRP